MDFRKHPKTDFKDIRSLSKKEAQEEVEALREGIEYHDYLYYVKNAPEISDATYDRLFRRLQELEEAFAELRSESSPTQRVGAEPVDQLNDVPHASVMLSLNAALEEQDVIDFDDFIHRNAPKKDICTFWNRNSMASRWKSFTNMADSSTGRPGVTEKRERMFRRT
jgi:DNA ligase (NAD+)